MCQYHLVPSIIKVNQVGQQLVYGKLIMDQLHSQGLQHGDKVDFQLNWKSLQHNELGSLLIKHFLQTELVERCQLVVARGLPNG